MGRMMGYSWGNDPANPSQTLPCGASWGGYGMMGTLSGPAQGTPCTEAWRGYGPGGYGMMGPGMMGGAWNRGQMPCGGAYTTPGAGEIKSLEEAETAIGDYVEGLGYTGLEVTEVMEFELNYYAIVAENDTGIGAMELLVDKSSGAAGPEPGPNMMWNAKYGMMGRGGYGMMGQWRGDTTGEMTVTPAQAVEAAQRWLDANLPGRTAGEADAFYGYYTLHFLKDGVIEGMLSVHGSSGDIWYHSWHGDFIAMAEGHD